MSELCPPWTGITYDSELTVLEISKGNRIMGVINVSYTALERQKGR